MLSAFIDSPARLRALQRAPGGAWLDGFARQLAHDGYATITARRHLRAAEHFIAWTQRTHLAIEMVGPASLDHFRRHLSQCRCRPFGCSDRTSPYSVRLFIGYLGRAGTIPEPRVTPTVPVPPLLGAFRQWMHAQRGTQASTLDNYAVHVDALLRRVEGDPAAIDAGTLRQFVLDGHTTQGWAAAKKRTTALRMFVRFLVIAGHSHEALIGAIPVLAHWRLAGLPRYFSTEEVGRIIASCDPRTPIGIRDRAILLLLARLGLRAGDIVGLQRPDIDWTGASLRVCGKGRREARLPLTEEVGHALVAYLTHARPATSTAAVFVRQRAPFRAFRSHSAVSVIVAEAIRRAGVRRPSRGAAHLLRHSVASAMLRHGASLREVAAVLRHQSTTTTEIYAKVDVTALRQIAQPWPEVAPC